MTFLIVSTSAAASPGQRSAIRSANSANSRALSGSVGAISTLFAATSSKSGRLWNFSTGLALYGGAVVRGISRAPGP